MYYKWQWLEYCMLNVMSVFSVYSSEFYEGNALMMEEEGAVIAGLLVGLNVIDANLCMKGEDLDSQVFLHFSVLPFCFIWTSLVFRSLFSFLFFIKSIFKRNLELKLNVFLPLTISLMANIKNCCNSSYQVLCIGLRNLLVQLRAATIHQVQIPNMCCLMLQKLKYLVHGLLWYECFSFSWLLVR